MKYRKEDNIQMNFKQLRVKMLMCNDEPNIATLSKVIGRSFGTTQQKIQNNAFTQTEIQKIRCRYCLSSDDVMQIFFEGV